MKYLHVTTPSYSKAPSGYIALISVLILSAVLMVLVFAANTNAFFARANLSRAEDHAAARHAADGCALFALRALGIDGSIFESIPVVVHLDVSSICTLLVGSISGNTAKITARATSGTSVVVVKVDATRDAASKPFHPTTWGETAEK
ncbi:MAG: hypothetical protein V4480_04235 [Patescibacteria group bacterium]